MRCTHGQREVSVRLCVGSTFVLKILSSSVRGPKAFRPAKNQLRAKTRSTGDPPLPTHLFLKVPTHPPLGSLLPQGGNSKLTWISCLLRHKGDRSKHLSYTSYDVAHLFLATPTYNYNLSKLRYDQCKDCISLFTFVSCSTTLGQMIALKGTLSSILTPRLRLYSPWCLSKLINLGTITIRVQHRERTCNHTVLWHMLPWLTGAHHQSRWILTCVSLYIRRSPS